MRGAAAREFKLVEHARQAQNRPPKGADGCPGLNSFLVRVLVLFVLALGLAFALILVLVLVLGLLGFGVFNAALSMWVGCTFSVFQAGGRGFSSATFALSCSYPRHEDGNH